MKGRSGAGCGEGDIRGGEIPRGYKQVPMKFQLHFIGRRPGRPSARQAQAAPLVNSEGVMSHLATNAMSLGLADAAPGAPFAEAFPRRCGSPGPPGASWISE